jgi:hypothetical protein
MTIAEKVKAALTWVITLLQSVLHGAFSRMSPLDLSNVNAVAGLGERPHALLEARDHTLRPAKNLRPRAMIP